MNVRNCVCCGRLFRPTGDRRYCPECMQEDRKTFESVRNYIKEHPRAPMMEISQETGVPVDKIREYIRDGRLTVVPQDAGVRCEQCGQAVERGRFCPACARRMADEFRMETMPKRPARPRPLQDDEKREYIWNRFRRR